MNNATFKNLKVYKYVDKTKHNYNYNDLPEVRSERADYAEICLRADVCSRGDIPHLSGNGVVYNGTFYYVNWISRT